MNWIPVTERLPERTHTALDGPGLLVRGKDRNREWFSIGFYAHPFTVEASAEIDNYDYDESADMYYCKPGWYEPIPEVIAASMDYDCVLIHDPVTHWAEIVGPEQ